MCANSSATSAREFVGSYYHSIYTSLDRPQLPLGGQDVQMPLRLPHGSDREPDYKEDTSMNIGQKT